MKKIELDNEQITFIRDNISSGYSIPQIADKLNISSKIVRRYCRDLKLTPLKPTRRKSHRNDIDTNAFIKDYKRLSIVELKQKYKCSNNVIYRLVDVLSLSPKIDKIKKNIPLSDVKYLYSVKGYSIPHIATHYNCDNSLIWRILKSSNTSCNNVYIETHPEVIIKSILNNLNIDFIRNHKLPSKREIDFFIPSLRIGFEINGEYWHSESHRSSSYHYDKYMEAKNNHITLFQFWANDVINKSTIISNIIMSKMGLLTRCYARQTYVVDVSYDDAKEFYNDYHLQGGKCSFTFSRGLLHNDKLVAVMSFKIIEGHEYELVRFASIGCVVGGFSKLIKHSGCSILTTFSDNMYSDGGVYCNNGFIKLYDIPADYKYLYNGVLYHKFNFRKKRFMTDKRLKFNDKMTERELAKLNNLLRVYDAGKIKWQYSKN